VHEEHAAGQREHADRERRHAKHERTVREDHAAHDVADAGDHLQDGDDERADLHVAHARQG